MVLTSDLRLDFVQPQIVLGIVAVGLGMRLEEVLLVMFAAATVVVAAVVAVLPVANNHQHSHTLQGCKLAAEASELASAG